MQNILLMLVDRMEHERERESKTLVWFIGTSQVISYITQLKDNSLLQQNGSNQTSPKQNHRLQN